MPFHAATAARCVRKWSVAEAMSVSTNNKHFGVGAILHALEKKINFQRRLRTLCKVQEVWPGSRNGESKVQLAKLWHGRDFLLSELAS